MGNQTSIPKINFEDIQTIYNSNNYILINTMTMDLQHCLIPNTKNITEEEHIINECLNTNKLINIIIYGKNCNDNTIYTKYEQLYKLGFINVYIYPGGMFEWLTLQDIYGSDNFPTKKKELDLLKYKPRSEFNQLYILPPS